MEHKFEVIDCLRVVLVILIIFLHAYTATMFVEWLHKGYPMYAFITYNFALLGGYIAVPFSSLFLVSFFFLLPMGRSIITKSGGEESILF